MFKEMVNSGYFMYMAEASGRDDLISTRVAVINSIIRDFKFLVRNNVDISDDYVQMNVFAKHKIDRDSLSFEERQKIEREVR